jgi:hypothetical protein
MKNEIVNATTEATVRRKRRGRPPAQFPRVVLLKLWASVPEAHRINVAASANRLPRAAYIRKSALAEISRPLPVCDIETASEIARVGHIFDQAVRLCQSGQVATWPTKEIIELRELCDALAIRLANPDTRTPWLAEEPR